MSTPPRRSRRLVKPQRLDYKELNKTGRRVFIDKDSYNSYSLRSTELINVSSDSEVDSSNSNGSLEYSTPNNSTETLSISEENRSTKVDEVAVLVSTCHLENIRKEMNGDTTNQNTVNEKMVPEVKVLQRKLSSLQDDIEDHIDEHAIDGSDTVEDVDVYISKAEKLRADYRKLVKDLKGVLDDNQLQIPELLDGCDDVISNVKNYILDAKKRKSELRCMKVDEQNKEKFLNEKLQADNDNQKNRTVNFLLNEVRRRMIELKNEFTKSQDIVNDEELIRRHHELSENNVKVEQLSQKLQHALEMMPETYPDSYNVVKTTTDNYNKLLKEKDWYEKFVKNEMEKREILKQDKFETSLLNIKLPKFSGYNSELDIYSFKTQFEKLHVKCTPTAVLPDLLKNNYLEEPALSLVKRLNNIDEIWTRLRKAYGDARIMLKNKLFDMKKIGPLWKLKDVERIKYGLATLLNLMSDLLKLAKEHNIEQKLYNGEALDVIYALMGDGRVTRWLASINEEEELVDGDLWRRLVKFLEKELKVQEEKSLINFKLNMTNVLETNTRDNLLKHKSSSHYSNHDNEKEMKCSFCDEDGHSLTNGPNKSKIIQYFACKKFVEMNPAQRFKELFNKGLCFQCLYPGAMNNKGKHADGTCQNDYVCKDDSHKKHKRKKHVLVCQEHCDSENNVKLFEEFKSKFITPQRNVQEFSKNIKLAFVSSYFTPYKQSKLPSPNPNDDDVVKESGIYLLQQIEVDNKPYTVFFDTGCSDFVSRHEAVMRIGSKSRQEVKGPIEIGGVGDSKIVSKHGVYEVKLPLYDGKNAVFFGICLDKISSSFPLYPLQGEVKRDIYKSYELAGGNPKDLPSLPNFVGGDVDFMVGTKYLRYHPRKVFTLLSGLTIYESPFQGYDGTRGVVGGPHKVFTEIQKQNSCHHVSYLTEQYRLYQMGYQVNPDNHLLSIKMNKQFDINENDDECDQEEFQFTSFTAARKQKKFNEVESAGSEILYRCLDCRKCGKCKNGEQIELVSIKEEVEQDVINKSVSVDTKNGKTVAQLPLMDDPITKLAPNKKKAMAVFKSQLKKLNKCEKDKMDVINSENKLQELGHVDYVKNLPVDVQKKLESHPIKNYIPWRCVWNSNSVTTPCRVVFDASQPTASSYSLNDILAKGRNNMNKLVEIVIRWRSYKHAYHSDVQKMYNSVKLIEDHWCFQRYIWEKNLDPNMIPQEKVIKTLIYGVKSSGNQAECGLRKTAKMYEKDYPEVSKIVHNDIYVDDCLSGEHLDVSYQRADEISLVLKNGGFGLKGFTFSGGKPLSNLSEDGESIKCAGMRWYSESDELQLDVGEPNFAKKVRGKKVMTEKSFEIPERLTRRQCVGKVAEVYDLNGRFTPVIAHMKLDLHELVTRKLDWDDAIPDELRHVWVSHMEMIKEISKIKFKRGVVPDDAVNTEINTVDVGDASMSIACAAIYARFLRSNGDYSCQLVFARSKLLDSNITQPRAELLAAFLNTHTGEVVRRSLSKYHRYSTKLTDSKIVLSWINNKDIPLKPWVRNRVVEITRFTDPSSWMHVSSDNVVADLGTRRGATINDILPDSKWDLGLSWMTKDISNFPGNRYEELKLSPDEQNSMENEVMSCKKAIKVPWYEGPASCNIAVQTSSVSQMQKIPKDVGVRYQYSNYIIDPNKHRFRDVVRILAIVLRFIRNCQIKCSNNKLSTSQKSSTVVSGSTEIDLSNAVVLSDEDIKYATDYYYKKATNEVKTFTKRTKYANISHEKNNILYYTGRILPEEKVNSVVPLAGAMKDLSQSTFCIPIIDKHSPLAYSIMNEIHWYDKLAMHAGVETLLRRTMQYAYILEGREIAKKIKRGCERCRYIYKRTIDVVMGPVSQYNLTIAPPFFISQIDIAGPFKAYSLHNKRTTIKIYFCVFCCATTTAVSIKVLEDYTTSAFLQAFIRFSCESGYPKVLFVDEGSQLVKGCQTMGFCFQDTRHRLNTEVNVEFETCPVGGHNMNGRVERKIKHIKESVEKTMQNERLSILQWETVASEIANSINDLPIAVGNVVADLENIDLLTPNRLRLGRNNQRSPVGPLWVTGKPDKFLEANQRIFDAWFNVWLITCVPHLVIQPKWFKSDEDVSVGDIVLFLKKEGELNNKYQYGRISEAPKGRDGKIRKVSVTYRNHNENVDRITRRAVRELVMIHAVEEINIFEGIGKVANATDVMYKLQSEKK